MKLKSNVKKILIIVIVGIILVSGGIYTFIKIKEKKEYEQTYTYKLISLGYEKDDVRKMTDSYGDNELLYITNQEKDNIYTTIFNEEYFIYSNFYAYINYYNEHKEEPINNIIEKVNTQVHEDYYNNTTPADTSKGNLLLVNKYYYLKDDYEPDDLVTISLDYSYGELGSQKVTKETYEAFLNMWKASNEAGFYLMVNSSYRTYQEQQEVYDDYAKSYGTDYADSIAARPGFSEHQTGLSIDVFEQGTGQKDFANTESYKWLKENAHKYGFIERYPEDKVDITGYSYESWHYRYVGVEAATYIYEHKITFDEYYAYFVK